MATPPMNVILPSPDPAHTPPPEPRWRVWACFMLMLAAIQIALGPKLRLSQWQIGAANNAGLAEGEAWLHGRLDIPHDGRDAARDRMHDTAYFNGKVYNVFPPLVGCLHVLLSPLHRLLLGRADQWLPPLYVALCFAPLPILAYAIFRRQTHDSAWAALLTVAWLGGTAVLPNLRFAREGQLGQLNHVLSQIGLLLLAADLLGPQRHANRRAPSEPPAEAPVGQPAFSVRTPDASPGRMPATPILLDIPSQNTSCPTGLEAGGRPPMSESRRSSAGILARQRIWPAVIGLAIAAWTRQATILYALPLLWVARTRGRLPMALAGVALVALPLLALNQLKFGRPLEFGYGYIYENRHPDDEMAQRFRRHGAFSPRWIPDNLYYMNVAAPAMQSDLTGLQIVPSAMGAGIWLTTPLLLMVFLAARQWWRDPRRRLLMLATLPVLLAVLCYHSPGFQQFGYYRFALDFIPIWLIVIAPCTRGRWRTWFTLACTAWSLLYFQAIVPNA